MPRFARCVFAVFLAVSFLTSNLACQAAAPETAAAAFILMEAGSGRVLASRNETQERSIASTTKIMTCLVALEHSELTEKVTVKREHLREGSSMYLLEGETLTMEELLYGLMLPSGNDAAECIAAHCGGNGGSAQFVRWMNEKAKALGMEHTSFANPSGLDEMGHSSCALDMARLAAYAMQNPTFARIVSTRTASVGTRTMTNHNKLLASYSGCVGLKTGYTSAAGRCLIATAEDDGIRFLSVLCGAKTSILDTGDLLMESFPETIKLLDYGFDNFSYVTALSPLYPIDQVTVLNSAGSEAVAVAPAKDVRLLLPANYNPDALRTEILLDAKEVEAPVSEGQKLGLARVYYGNELIDETDLLAIADVTRSEFSSVASTSTAYIQQNWWKWIVFLILGVIAAFLILLVLLQIRRRRLRRLRLEKRRRDLEKQYRRRYRDDREE